MSDGSSTWLRRWMRCSSACLTSSMWSRRVRGAPVEAVDGKLDNNGWQQRKMYVPEPSGKKKVRPDRCVTMVGVHARKK
jgi:hypothetical protein